MPKTGKGIYIKSNPSCGVEDGKNKTGIIANITYEDILITEPDWCVRVCVCVCAP
jgi:hypothetical protein